jgi:protein-L-isoaspartate O-methyltransferase
MARFEFDTIIVIRQLYCHMRNRTILARVGAAHHARAALAGLAMAATVAGAFPARALAWGTDSAAMADRISALLALKPGDTVAEIGAGHGYMAVRVAEQVGPAGRLYATEVDSAELNEIARRAAQAGLANVTVVKGSDTGTGLAPECCNAIYMTGVYHHFTDPLAMDRSLYASLKPGGRMFIADFYPTWLLWFWATPAMKRNFGGHGVAEPLMVSQLTAAGFRLVEELPGIPSSWVLNNYSVVFEKPAPPAPR